MKSVWFSVVIGFLMSLPPLGAGEVLYYSFWDGTNGGISKLVLDEQGRVLEQETLFAEPESERVTMMDLTRGGDWLVLINEQDEDFSIISMAPEERPLPVLKLYPADRPEIIRAFGDYAIVTGNEGKIHTINPRRPSVVGLWDGRQEIEPPVYRPDDVLVLPEQNVALVAFRQDFRGGRRLGNRIIVFDVARLEVLADHHLPRDREEFHYPDGSQDVGPNPHRLFAWPERDLLAVFLENYGAVTFARLQAALEGEWKELGTFPTSKDEEWGTGFPQSGVFFEVEGHPYFMASNASEEGGVALFDLEAMERIQFLSTGPLTLRDPVWFPGQDLLVTTRLGWKKTRGEEEIELSYDDFHDVLTFDLSPLAAGGEVQWEVDSLEEILYDLRAVDPERSDLVILYAMGDKPTLHVWDVLQRRSVDSAESRGLLRTVVPAR